MSDASKLPVLTELIEHASDWVDAYFPKNNYSVSSAYIVLTRSGVQTLLKPPPVDKEAGAQIMRGIFRIMDVIAFVFYSEAWKVAERARNDSETMEQVLDRLKLSGSLEHVPGRVEVVYFHAEYEGEGTLSAQRDILRREGEPAALGPLTINYGATQTDGRLAGLLPAPAPDRRH